MYVAVRIIELPSHSCSCSFIFHYMHLQVIELRPPVTLTLGRNVDTDRAEFMFRNLVC